MLALLRASRPIHAMLMVLSVGSLGCRHWAPAAMPTATAPVADTLTHYRLTAADGVKWRFRALQFRNDSILGTQLPDKLPRVLGLAVADIAKVERREDNLTGTVVVLGVLGGLVYAINDFINNFCILC